MPPTKPIVPVSEASAAATPTRYDPSCSLNEYWRRFGRSSQLTSMIANSTSGFSAATLSIASAWARAVPTGIELITTSVAPAGIAASAPSPYRTASHTGPELRLGHQALVGKQGIVLDEVSAQGGQIRIGGEVWTARPYDDSEVIEAGAAVDVFEIRGATALVHKIPTLGS